MDTLMLYGKDDLIVESHGLQAGPLELVWQEITEVLTHPAYAWVDRYELLACGVVVDEDGWPVPDPRFARA